MIDYIRNRIAYNFSENEEPYKFIPYTEECDHEVKIIIKVPFDKMMDQVARCIKKIIEMHKDKYDFFEPVLTRNVQSEIVELKIDLKLKSPNT